MHEHGAAHNALAPVLQERLSMKRLIIKNLSLLTVLMLCLLCPGFSAAAESNIRVLMNYSRTHGELVVSGTLENEIGNVPMTLKVVKGESIWAVAETTATAQDDVVSFTFPSLKFGDSAALGDYTVYVGSMYTDEVFCGTFTYNGEETAGSDDETGASANAAGTVFELTLSASMNLNPQTLVKENFSVTAQSGGAEVEIADVMYYPSAQCRVKLCTKELLNSSETFLVTATGVCDVEGNAVEISRILSPGVEFNGALDAVYLQGLSYGKAEEGGLCINATLANSSQTAHNTSVCYLVLYNGRRVAAVYSSPVTLSAGKTQTVCFNNVAANITYTKAKVLVFDHDKNLKPLANSGYELPQNVAG